MQIPPILLHQLSKQAVKIYSLFLGNFFSKVNFKILDILFLKMHPHNPLLLILEFRVVFHLAAKTQGKLAEGEGSVQ